MSRDRNKIQWHTQALGEGDRVSGRGWGHEMERAEQGEGGAQTEGCGLREGTGPGDLGG